MLALSLHLLAICVGKRKKKKCIRIGGFIQTPKKKSLMVSKCIGFKRRGICPFRWMANVRALLLLLFLLFLKKRKRLIAVLRGGNQLHHDDDDRRGEFGGRHSFMRVGRRFINRVRFTKKNKNDRF